MISQDSSEPIGYEAIQWATALAAWPWLAADAQYNRHYDGNWFHEVISLSSRRRERLIAQMMAVKAGGGPNM